MAGAARPRVIIVGAGFGGLYAAKALANKEADVLLIDRNNYHTFLPLLYQVATSGLEPEEVAAPVRGILRHARNMNFLLGEVTRVDPQSRLVYVQIDGEEHTRPYDYLILSPGTVTNFFGMKDVEARAFGLKSLNEAVKLRNHVLSMFERAAAESDPARQIALMTVVVVGGGPTGLEMSGALRELFDYVLRKDYPKLDISKARVVLVEATDRLLTPFPELLRKSALRQIKRLGVEVLLNKTVSQVTDDTVLFKDGSQIATHTIIWAAGVQAAPLNGLNVPLQRAQRIPTLPTLQMADHPTIYVIGDANYLTDEAGQPHPQLAQVAMQMAQLVVKNILASAAGQAQQTFHYHDPGIMATVGRSKAVAWIFNRVQLSGWIAWMAWLGLHLIYLIGFRNRFNVLVNWAWNWWTWERGVRIILNR